MQDIILARIWVDHHERIYGDVARPPAEAGPAAATRSDPLPSVGKALAMALIASVVALSAGVATA